MWLKRIVSQNGSWGKSPSGGGGSNVVDLAPDEGQGDFFALPPGKRKKKKKYPPSERRTENVIH